MIERPGLAQIMPTLTPAAMTAIRWHLFAERVWPVELNAWVNEVELKTPEEVRRSKSKARMYLTKLKKILYPPDEVSDGS
jgi:hypothetical protein